MMMKRCLSMLLVLAMLLPCFAAAEAAPAEAAPAEAAPAYEPGKVSRDLFAEAFEGGKLVCTNLDAEVALNAEVLGLNADEAVVLDAVVEMINSTILGISAAKTDEGIVVQIAADYQKEGAENSANAEVSIGLSKGGVFVETSLLPGERVTATWETVLELCGADEESIDEFLGAMNIDLDQMATELSEIAANLQQISKDLLDIGSTLCTPYLEALTAFVAELPVSVTENVAAESYFPAAKKELTYGITLSDLGKLITLLANQLESDPITAALLDAVLTNPQLMGEDTMTTSALCETMRMVAAELNGDEPVFYIFVGSGEADQLLYMAFSLPVEDGSSLCLNVADTTEAGDDGKSYVVDAFMVDAQGLYSGAALSWYYDADPADKQVFDVAVAFELMIQDVSLVSLEYAFSKAAMTTEENMPGYSGYQSATANVADLDTGAPISVVSSAEFQHYLTADGGEEQISFGQTDTTVGETSMQAIVESYMAAIPTEDGPVARFAEYLEQPATGIDSLMLDVSIFTLPYRADEGASVLALETATEEEMNDLLMRLVTNIQEPLETLVEQLPAPILEMIAGEETPADTL